MICEKRCDQMPSKLLKFCEQPGCSELVSTRFCTEHTPVVEPRKDYRESASARGYDVRWRRESKAFLLKHPLCVECQKLGEVTPAKVVDHIVPHKGNKKIFWDRSNWQALCKKHHDIKTAKEDGAFGRKSESYLGGFKPLQGYPKDRLGKECT